MVLMLAAGGISLAMLLLAVAVVRADEPPEVSPEKAQTTAGKALPQRRIRTEVGHEALGRPGTRPQQRSNPTGKGTTR